MISVCKDIVTTTVFHSSAKTVIGDSHEFFPESSRVQIRTGKSRASARPAALTCGNCGKMLPPAIVGGGGGGGVGAAAERAAALAPAIHQLCAFCAPVNIFDCRLSAGLCPRQGHLPFSLFCLLVIITHPGIKFHLRDQILWLIAIIRAR